MVRLRHKAQEPRTVGKDRGRETQATPVHSRLAHALKEDGARLGSQNGFVRGAERRKHPRFAKQFTHGNQRPASRSRRRDASGDPCAAALMYQARALTGSGGTSMTPR